MPRILADASIPHVRDALGALGDLQLLDGSAWRVARVEDGDLLAVRTTTRVDESLLGEVRPGIVATASAGVDHLDLEWLGERGIEVASAPGCNAEAVAQWVTSTVLELEGRGALAPQARFGVVGFGQTGRRVVRNLRALGHSVRACDPFVDDVDEALVSFEQVLATCDAVSCHVPLTDTGPHPTRGLLDRPALSAGPTLFINASRGELLETGETPLDPAGPRLALDVFPGEPELDPGLLATDGPVVLATPHVAGYSLEGKINATRAVHEAFAAHLGLAPSWDGRAHLGELEPVDLRRLAGDGPRARLRALLRMDCDPWTVDRELRALATADPGSLGRSFTGLRRRYPLRREPSARVVRGAGPATIPRTWLEALGYSVG